MHFCDIMLVTIVDYYLVRKKKKRIHKSDRVRELRL